VRTSSLSSRTKRLLVEFAFGTLGCRRVFATADPDNGASCRVLQKSGLAFVATIDDVETWRGPRPRVVYELARDSA
jgi:RimJ/RimL family protein N-acetyltransferase